MTNSIEINPCGSIHGTIRPPGSKSITNRALVCAALAKGTSQLRNTLDSDDTRIMIECLNQLEIEVDFDSESRIATVPGCEGRIPASKADLFVGNSGTTIRFLTAVLSLGHGAFELDGVPRMRQRPIGDLIASLRAVGVDISAADDNRMPPVQIVANGLPGGELSIRGDASSQYLSGLLMAAPYAHRDVIICVSGPLVSRPYVDMTVQVMASFGVGASATEAGEYRIPSGQRYIATDYTIEPDASAASYFWGAAAITGGRVTVPDLHPQSLQGDVQFCEALRQMGCDVEYDESGTTVAGGSLRGIDIDMGDFSDTVQTLAMVALFAEGPTNIRNVAHVRHKETDRIGDLARELRKLGANIDERDDGLTITPGPLRSATIDTYDDHRMAMSFALVGLRQPGVVIADPECTSKTYPNYFVDLRRLCQT